MKKTFSLTRLLTALLMLCMLLACLFGTAAAEEFRGYIATIGLVAADTVEEAKRQLIDTGHVVVDVDLNEGTQRGQRVYMGYTLTNDPAKAITGLMVRYDELEINYSPVSTAHGYYLVGSSKEANSAGGGIVDLNKNTSDVNFYANPIHLYVQRDPAGDPLTDIIVLNTDIVPDKYMKPYIDSTVVDGFAGTSFVHPDRLHLNYGAEGGSRLYMYIQRFHQIVPTTVLNVYYLSDTGDNRSYKADKRFNDHTDTLSFDGAPQTVTFDGMSFTLEGWHDHWADDGAPTITDLTPEAGFEALGSGVVYKDFYAAYSHNLTMSFDALEGTGAPAALTQKQYLNVGYIDTELESKSFLIPNTVPVHTDPSTKFYAWNTKANGKGYVYHPGQTLTLSKDMTLYAMWTVNSSECTITLEKTEYIADQYNATEKKPGVVVTHNGTTLTAGVDYTYWYDWNVNPGMAKVTVSFKGQYTGTAKVYFSIAEMTVSADAVYIGYDNYRVPPATGSSTRTVTLTAMANGIDVTDETTWSIQGSNESQSTEGISVQGNQLIFTSGAVEGTSIAVTGRYKDGSGVFWIRVEKDYLPLTNVVQYETNYNGLPQMPTVIVGDGTLVEGVDYVVTYLRNGVETDDFTNVGEINAQVTGIGGYTGTRDNSYFIRSCPVSSARAEYIKEFIYNGRPQKPQLTLTLDSGYQLREGVDYTLSYERADGDPDDLTSIGTIYIYPAAVEGGNFNGSDMMSYRIIDGYDITSGISINRGYTFYDGLPHPATVVVTYNGDTLAEGLDYTVTYTRDGVETTDVTNAGTVTVEVKGKGSYIGSKSKVFDIYPIWLEPYMVNVSADTTWNGSSQKPTVSVPDVAATDYTVTFTRDGVETDDFTTCGTIAVKVTGVNNANGTVTKEYVINHHPDMTCGHADDFALRYQSEPGAKPKYTNDLSYLQRSGIITLQKPITIRNQIIRIDDLTLVMNGQTITLSTDSSCFHTYSGSMTIDATAGGSIVFGTIPTDWASAIAQTRPLTIKGNLVLGDKCMIRSGSNDPIDLSGYTGSGLIIRGGSRYSEQKPLLPEKYELISWTVSGGDGKPITNGTLYYDRFGKVVKQHEHAWTFTASGNVITATCTNAGCKVPNGTATITLANPENLIYDGSPKIVTIQQSPADTFPVLPTANYLCADSCTDVGVHTATLTYQGATAETTFTIQPMDITGATVGPFAEMTFNRAAQTPEATVTLGLRTVTGTWSSVTNVSDLTTFTANGNYTGTIADQATGMKKAKPTAEDFVLAAPQNPIYDGLAKKARVYRAGSASGMGMFLPYYYPASSTPDTHVSPIVAGEYIVGLWIDEGDNFLAHSAAEEPLILGSFTIEPAQPVMTAETNRTTYRYGDIIIVTGTVEVLQQDGNPVDFIARDAHHVALYDDEGNQLCESVSLRRTSYSLFYDSSLKALKPGEDLTLTVKFTGDANIADQSAVTNTFTLVPAPAYPELTGAAAKVFDGTTDVPADHTLSLSLAGILDGDEVGVTGTFAYANSTPGSVKFINVTNFELEGGDAAFYQLDVDIVSEPVGIITPAKLTDVEPPANKALTSHYEYAEEVSLQLPAAVTFHVEGGSTVDINVRWFCESYDNTPSAVNTFFWEVDDAYAMSCYEPDSTVAITGSILVWNRDPLPVTVIGTPATITYNGEPYDATAMFTFDPNAGERIYCLLEGTTGDGQFEGSMLNIVGAGNFNIAVSTAENGIYSSSMTSAMLTVEKGTPNVAAPTGLTAHYTATLNMLSLPSDENGAWSWDDPTAPVGDVGQRFHKAVYMPYDTGVWNTVEADVAVTVIQADTVFDDDVGVFNQGTATNCFTYGDTVTVKVKPVPAPASPAMFSLRSRPAPQPGQMALYLRANGTDTQITDPVSADENGVYTMDYATTGKDLAIGVNTLVAKYVGDESMADKEQEVDITLEPKELIIVTITAQSRAYEKGNDQVSVTGVELSGVESGDSVAVDTTGLTATLSGDDAALYGMAEVPLEPTLSGDDADYYFLVGSVSVDVAQGGVEITKKQAVLLTASLYPNSFVYNGSAQKPTVTVTDGTILLTDGVDYIITWPANCTDVGEKAILITFIGNYSGTTALSYEIVESQIPLVIVKQPADQFVTEGERAKFSVEATGAGLTWQWYINRNDGRGWRAIDGAVTSTYVTSVTDAECDGFQYRCTVGDRYGSAVQSAAAVLHVTKIPVLPETGDASAPLLWLALSLLSVTGIAFLRKKAHTR